MFYNHVQLERERDMPGEFFLGWNPLVSKIVFGLECFLAFASFFETLGFHSGKKTPIIKLSSKKVVFILLQIVICIPLNTSVLLPTFSNLPKSQLFVYKKKSNSSSQQ